MENHDQKLERARELLDGGEPTLNELAAAVGLSASHLQRKFQARYGISPAEYLSQKKLGALKPACAPATTSAPRFTTPATGRLRACTNRARSSSA